MAKAVSCKLKHHVVTLNSCLFGVLLILGGLYLALAESLDSTRTHRVCMERIWPDFQRCRERQREYYRYGRFSSGSIFGSSDVFQPKYKAECCSYWHLLECVHKAAKIYCSDDINLKTLDKFVEMVGLNVPLYICSDEYPKGTLKCKMPSWFVLTIGFIVLGLFVLFVLLFICIRSSK